MTLSSETVKVQYDGNGGATAFGITFAFWDADDLRVILRSAAGVETVWTRGTQYTVTGGDGSTGTLTVVTSPTDYTPASGTTLTIKSALADTQPTDLPLGGAFPSSSVEQQLDKTVRLVQQKDERLTRAILLRETSTFTDITVPDPEAGTVLRWNDDEDALENATIIGSGSITIPMPISQGGTNAITKAAGFDALAPTTTRGDIITRGASGNGRVAVGAANKVLESDGTDPAWQFPREEIVIACSDEATALTTGTAKITFRMPFAMTVTAVRASLATAQSSGSIFTVDINESGTTILSTKLTIDNTEKTSTTAVTAAVVSDSALADDAEITIDIDQVGNGTAKGLKVALIGRRA